MYQMKLHDIFPALKELTDKLLNDWMSRLVKCYEKKQPAQRTEREEKGTPRSQPQSTVQGANSPMLTSQLKEVIKLCFHCVHLKSGIMWILFTIYCCWGKHWFSKYPPLLGTVVRAEIERDKAHFDTELAVWLGAKNMHTQQLGTAR